MYPIIQAPDGRLLTKTNAVAKVTPELVEIAKEMYKTMIAANGLGLAANQVGLDMSLIVLEDDGKMLALFNPVILSKSPEQKYDDEGCLSFGTTLRKIKRSIEVKVKYRDEHNKMMYKTFQGVQARAVLHEVDHLRGVLYTSYEEKKD